MTRGIARTGFAADAGGGGGIRYVRRSGQRRGVDTGVVGRGGTKRPRTSLPTYAI